MAVRFSAIEHTLMEETFDPETLRAHVPGMGDVLDGAAMLRDALHEANVVGEYQRANGFNNSRTMQRVAKIDTNLMLMLEELHKAGCIGCSKKVFGAGGHKEYFMKWLALHGQAFDVRRKVTL